MDTAIQVHLPDELISQAQRLVQEGWATAFDDVVAEALRRYVKSHGPALSEAFVREDVAWGLHGRD